MLAAGLPTIAGAIASVLFGGSAAAAPKAKAGANAGDPRIVDMSGLVLPVARGGRLVNYLFFNLRMVIETVDAAAFVRERHFLFRDALVRLAGRRPVPAGANRDAWDRSALIGLAAAALTETRPGSRLVSADIQNPALMRP